MGKPQKVTINSTYTGGAVKSDKPKPKIQPVIAGAFQPEAK
jgi:hypothetical protein